MTLHPSSKERFVNLAVAPNDLEQIAWCQL